ncbi:MAG: hypothetical protein ABIT04_09640 [Novosphingobium sp.]
MRRVDPRVLDLNPAFLLEHQIAPLSVRGQTLEVGLRNINDGDAIAALRFATGLEIEARAMTEAEWVQWSAALARAVETNCAEAALELGETTVHVRSPPECEGSFSVTDRKAWSALRAQLGKRPVVTLTLREEATWRMELAEVPRDLGELRRLLEARSPVRLDQIAWSTPLASVAGLPATVYCVRKTWLRARLATVRRELGAEAVTIIDAGGSRFDFKTEQPRRRVETVAAVCGLALAVGAVSAGGWGGVQGLSRHAEAPGRSAPQGVAGAVSSPAPHPAAIPLAPVNNGAEHFELVGIVGRLPVDAVALVRPPWGKTVTLRVGDSLLGWTLTSISADRVTLVKAQARQELVMERPPAG